MGQRKSLQPHEIRVIKIDRKAILNLSWEILSQISYKKFRLPQDENSTKRIRIGRYFDEEQCEIILLAHSAADEINQEAVIRYIQNAPVEAIDSLLLNTIGNDYYRSIQDSSFVVDRPNATRAKFCGCGLSNAWGKLCAMLNGSVRPLRKHEIRVIRLSKAAIQELLWEHFIKIGDNVMDILEEDSSSVIFGMHTAGNLEALTLYAINLNEASDDAFEEVNAYCDQNIGFTTDSLSQKPANGQHYVSVTLLKP